MEASSSGRATARRLFLRSGLGGIVVGGLAALVIPERQCLAQQPGQPPAIESAPSSQQRKPDEATGASNPAIPLEHDLAQSHIVSGNNLKDEGKLDEAIAEFREAARIKPELAEAHNNLGKVLEDQGKLEDATAEYKIVVRLEPDLAKSRCKLAVSLAALGKLDEGIDELKRAVRLGGPEEASSRTLLGDFLCREEKLNQAINELKTAIRLNPDLAAAHCVLGMALQRQNRFCEALQAFERGHDLGSTREDWSLPSARWVVQARLCIDIEPRIPAIMAGKDRPANADEAAALADICYNRHFYGASARYWNDAFHAQPALAGDLMAAYRYNAACSAALAGAGKGNDHAQLDDAAKRAGATRLGIG